MTQDRIAAAGDESTRRGRLKPSFEAERFRELKRHGSIEKVFTYWTSFDGFDAIEIHAVHGSGGSSFGTIVFDDSPEHFPTLIYQLETVGVSREWLRLVSGRIEIGHIVLAIETGKQLLWW